MSIESSRQHQDKSTQPLEQVPQEEWSPEDAGVSTSAKARVPYEQHDKKKLKNNPIVKRILIGVTALGLVGAGATAANMLGNDDAEPTAEAPANPGEAAPDNPAAENPGTSPTDIPVFEDDQPTVDLEDPYAIDFESMTNQEILDKHSLDLNFVTAQGSPWVLEQMRNLGSQPPLVDAQLMWDTDQNDPGSKDNGYVPSGYESADGTFIQFYEPLNTNVQIAMNTISANMTIIDQPDSAESGRITDGIFVDIIRGREQAMNQEIEYFDVRQQPVVENLINLVRSHPEGTVFKDVNLSINTDASADNQELYGTTIYYGYREPGADKFEYPDVVKLSDKPVTHYNLAERTITPPGEDQVAQWDENNQWDPYNPQSPQAKSLFPREH